MPPFSRMNSLEKQTFLVFFPGSRLVLFKKNLHWYIIHTHMHARAHACNYCEFRSVGSVKCEHLLTRGEDF